jgi:hypothetical protein
LLSGKQDTLVSGTNIKTINGESVLGSGDLVLATDKSFTTATVTVDRSDSNNQEITITANSTLTQTNLPNGQTCFLKITD